MARSTARKRALNTLYEADEKGQDIPSLLAERIANPGAQTPLPDYAIELVQGVADHKEDIDRQLDAYSTKWTVRRMAVVDRNILRIAAWEILFSDEVPDRVAIDEALGLAKTLSDDETPSFVHGLLSAISSNKEAALADIKAAEQERAERARQEAALHAPTAPGFLTSGGVSGHGDGEPMQWGDETRSADDGATAERQGEDGGTAAGADADVADAEATAETVSGGEVADEVRKPSEAEHQSAAVPEDASESDESQD